jgi:hypothetical protein
LFFSAVAVPIQIAVAYTNGTQATVGSTTIVVDSATGIAVGQAIQGAGIQSNTTVVGISGTTVTISQATNAALSETPLTFSAPSSPQPPGIIAVALGI